MCVANRYKCTTNLKSKLQIKRPAVLILIRTFHDTSRQQVYNQVLRQNNRSPCIGGATNITKNSIYQRCAQHTMEALV